MKDRCRQCERPLRPLKGTKGVLGYGYGGHGYFCSLRCAWRFAIDAIEDTEGTPGGSLAKKTKEEAEEKLADLIIESIKRTR
jgi:hypothetical protein